MLQYNDIEIEEFFARIPYCSDYLISNKGRVYSTISNKFIRPYRHGKGYLRMELKNNEGIYKKYFVHRLVVDTFGDSTYSRTVLPGYDIDHIDRNKHNNSINNLEIITHKENMNRWQKIKKEQNV